MKPAAVCISLFLCLALAGCAPFASTSIPLPETTDAGLVLPCSERTVTELAVKDDRWNYRVTKRDAVSGLLETGDYEDENVSGFRVRVQLDAEDNAVDIGLKGAGAYFVDLGVNDALTTFTTSLQRCLSAQQR